MKRVVTAQVRNEKLVSDRHERIIRAAITVFHQQGFHTTTTADIAREAGLTQSNLYNYIRSKQDVLFLVCEHLVSTYEQLIDKVIETESDSYLRIVGALREVVGAMTAYRYEVQLLYQETRSLKKDDRRLILGSISKFIGQFEALLSDYEKSYGVISLSDKRMAANLMSFLPAIGALRYWDLVRAKSTADRDVIVDFILRGLGVARQPNKS